MDHSHDIPIIALIVFVPMFFAWAYVWWKGF